MPNQQIFAEAFGPALRRSMPGSSATSFRRKVRFEKSQIEAVREPGSGTLLDLAERVGLAPDFNCRSGSCGECRMPVAAGEVTYDIQPTYPPAGEALLCCAVPARSELGEGGPEVVDAWRYHPNRSSGTRDVSWRLIISARYN
ncbi:(2Fe-2S)-binding protein [Mesorhizobium sp. B2-3-5]|nr:(2Fe-2S)-binding protein [Mesorhizobium sp. B2-3-5]